MMPSLACARASAASKSRYFCTRFSSDQISRIAGVVKMSRKMEESKIVEGMWAPWRWVGVIEGARGGDKLFQSCSAIQSALCERQR